MNLTHIFDSKNLTKSLPSIKPGMIIKVHQKIKDGDKTRIQVFEGMVIARKHGNGINGMVTVRKISNGLAVERIFPLHLPTIEKFEVVRSSKVRKAKLYYLRGKTAKETRRKTKTVAVENKTPVKPEESLE